MITNLIFTFQIGKTSKKLSQIIQCSSGSLGRHRPIPLAAYFIRDKVFRLKTIADNFEDFKGEIIKHISATDVNAPELLYDFRMFSADTRNRIFGYKDSLNMV